MPEGGAQLVKSGEGMEVVRRGTKRSHTLLAYDQGPNRRPFLLLWTMPLGSFFPYFWASWDWVYLHARRQKVSTATDGIPICLLEPGDSLTFQSDVTVLKNWWTTRFLPSSTIQSLRTVKQYRHNHSRWSFIPNWRVSTGDHVIVSNCHPWFEAWLWQSSRFLLLETIWKNIFFALTFFMDLPFIQYILDQNHSTGTQSIANSEISPKTKKKLAKPPLLIW